MKMERISHGNLCLRYLLDIFWISYSWYHLSNLCLGCPLTIDCISFGHLIFNFAFGTWDPDQQVVAIRIQYTGTAVDIASRQQTHFLFLINAAVSAPGPGSRQPAKVGGSVTRLSVSFEWGRQLLQKQQAEEDRGSSCIEIKATLALIVPLRLWWPPSRSTSPSKPLQFLAEIRMYVLVVPAFFQNFIKLSSVFLSLWIVRFSRMYPASRDSWNDRARSSLCTAPLANCR